MQFSPNSRELWVIFHINEWVQYSDQECVEPHDSSPQPKTRFVSQDEWDRVTKTLELAEVGICHISFEGKVLWANPFFCRFLGYTSEEVQGLNLKASTLPEDLAVINDITAKLINGEMKSASFDKRYQHKDGTYAWANVILRLLKDSDNHPQCFVAVIHDIDAKKKAEFKLLESERILKETQKIAKLGSWQSFFDSQEIIWSEEVYRIYGLEPSEFTPTVEAVSRFIHPEDLISLNKTIETAIKKKSTYELRYRIIRKDCKERILSTRGEVHVNENGQVDYLNGTSQDITEIVEIETGIAEAHKRLDLILDSTAEGICEIDLNGVCTFVNRAFLKLFGFNTSYEAIGKNLHYLIHYKKNDGAHFPIEECKLQADRFSLEGIHLEGERLWKADGTSFIGELWRHPVIRDQKVVGSVVTLLDITEKTTAIEAVHKSENSLSLALFASKAGTFELDVLKGVVYVSHLFQEIMGLGNDSKEISAERFFSLIHPEDLGKLHDVFQKTLYRENTQRIELRFIQLSGTLKWALFVGHPVEVKEGKVTRLVGLLMDITERKENEALIEAQKVKMVTASKMSSLGEMSSGLAHEINNPLAIIHGKAGQLKSLVKSGGATPEKLIEIADKIESTTMRISKIINSLRSFARDGTNDPFERVSLQSVTSETLELCAKRFQNYNVKLIINKPKEDLIIEARPVEISQVLLNLLNNSYDAVQNLSERWVEITFLELTPETVQITVTDSGKGIDKEIQEKVFQPFFTTKEIGKGTGLGLSVSKSIIDGHQGTLTVNAECPHTQILIILPKTQRRGLRSSRRDAA